MPTVPLKESPVGWHATETLQPVWATVHCESAQFPLRLHVPLTSGQPADVLPLPELLQAATRPSAHTTPTKSTPSRFMGSL